MKAPWLMHLLFLADFSVVRQLTDTRSPVRMSGFSVASQLTSTQSLVGMSDFLCQPT